MNNEEKGAAPPEWQQELGRLEQLIVEQRAAVAEGRYGEVRGYVLPDGLGSAPESVRPRLHSLLEETVAIERAIANQLDTMARRSLAAVAATRARARQPLGRPLFVEYSA